MEITIIQDKTKKQPFGFEVVYEQIKYDQMLKQMRIEIMK